MATEIVYRVAIAILEEHLPTSIWDRQLASTYVKLATAAIKAMREPTEEMLNSHQLTEITLDHARALHSSDINWERGWKAMIDEALK